jgi:hypothetical protein
MQNFTFRVARGLAVVVAIVVAHFVIAWLFHNMRIPAPDFGPVIATIFVEKDAEAAPGSSSPPAPAQPVNETPQKAPSVRERETAGSSSADSQHTL